MVKRISLKGKGADLFFGGDQPADPRPPAPGETPSQNNSPQTVGAPADVTPIQVASPHATEVASQHASMPAFQQATEPENRQAGVPHSPLAGSPERTAKVTYRLHLEAAEAMDEAKRILRRQHGIKVHLEEIAEEAILAAYRDLLENRHASMLVSRLSRRPATQHYGTDA